MKIFPKIIPSLLVLPSEAQAALRLAVSLVYKVVAILIGGRMRILIQYQRGLQACGGMEMEQEFSSLR